MSSAPAELARIHQVIAVLAERFPRCFAVLEARRRPLKLGIDQDIRAAVPDIDATVLSAALGYYTRSIGYLDGCRVGVPRVGLDGQDSGSVSDGEAAHAATRLANGIKRRAARRQASASSKSTSKSSPSSSPTSLSPSSSSPASSSSSSSRRDGLAALKAAALARRQQAEGKI
jgi:ProP effector